MNEEMMQRAAYTMESAAEIFKRSADSLDMSTHTLRQIFDPGNGGSLVRLTEALEEFNKNSELEDKVRRLIDFAAGMNERIEAGDLDNLAEEWNALPENLQSEISKREAELTAERSEDRAPLKPIDCCTGGLCDVCDGTGIFNNRKCDGIPF